jgi:hypothetical protein
MSRFAMVRSEDARLDDLADPSSLAGLDENDPKSMARWMRKMGKELGEDSSDLDEMADELEAGGGAEGEPDADDTAGGGEDDL